MKIKTHYKPLPSSDEHNCFGCSPSNATGLRMVFFSNATAVFSRVTIPGHLSGWSNVVHGGVVTAILDETMSWAAMYLLKRVSLTEKITVTFKKPVTIGSLVETEARILELKGKRQALVEGVLTNTDGIVCATAEGAFTTFSPTVAQRLKIADDSFVKWLNRLFES